MAEDEDQAPAPITMRRRIFGGENPLEVCDCAYPRDDDTGVCMDCQLPIQYRNNT